MSQYALSSESILAQSTLKVLTIPNAATSSLCCTLMLQAHPTLVSALWCLRSQSPSPQFCKHTTALSLSGSREATSQLGLNEGIHNPSLRWGVTQPYWQLSSNKPFLHTFEPLRTLSLLFNALEVNNGFRPAEPVLRFPFGKSCRVSLAPQVRKPRNLTPTALFLGASAKPRQNYPVTLVVASLPH